MSPRHSLRVRLTLWNVLIILLALFLLLVGARVAVVTSEYQELDSWLQADVQELAHKLRTVSVPQQLEPVVKEHTTFHSSLNYFVVLMGQDARPIWSTQTTPSGLTTSRFDLKLPVCSWQQFRLAGVPVKRGNIEGTLFVGAGTQQISDAVSAADQLLLWVGGIALLLIPVLAWALAGLALRPVVTMIETADHLQPERMTQRLPHADSNDELDRLARSVNGLLDRVGHFVTQKRDMLANAAHELRTPLAAIRSTAELALGQRRSPEEYEERLASIIDQGSSLEQLINQLLFLAEVDGERALQQTEIVDLHQVVERSTEMFLAIAESKRIEFTYRGTSAPVLGNRRYLSMLANNLIDNALKFTPSGGRVDVQLIHSPDQPTIELSVADTGMGISGSDLPRIFERFFRTDRARSRGGQTPGTGLGLSLVRAVVATHGGAIDVDSEVDRGTCFIVRLPRGPATRR